MTALADQMELRDGKQAPAWKIVRHNKYRRSTIVFVKLGTQITSRDIVIKFLSPSSVEAEYSRLRHAATASNSSQGYSVPSPIACIRETSAMIMEMCGGPSLTKFITNSAWMSTPGRITRCIESVHQCAMWLSAYHRSQTVSCDHQVLVGSLRDSIEDKLQTVSHDMSDIIPETSVRQLRKRLFHRDSKVNWSSFETGLLHHDFGCHNIIVGDRGIHVIDFGDTRAGFVLTDIERMRMELRVLDHSRAIRRNPRLFRDCLNAFDQACPPLPDNDRVPFELNCTLGFLLAIRRSKELGRRFELPWHGRATQYLNSRINALAA